MQRISHIILLCALSVCANRRHGRFFSVFNVVRFPNTECSSLENNLSGVCYTMKECARRNGRASGQCAAGFGVCCLFVVGCGGSSGENITYFSSEESGTLIEPSSMVEACPTTICKMDDGICQLRLDFLTFSMTGPSTSTVVASFTVNGQLNDEPNNVPVTTFGQCDRVRFEVVNPGSIPVPIICGENSGEHMYITSMTSDCTEIAVYRRTPATSFGEWMIRATQIRCRPSPGESEGDSGLVGLGGLVQGDGNRAPPGCLQWFFGAAQGEVKTFNFEGGAHLADQRQSICVRREANTCSICWFPTDPAADFAVSGPGMMGITNDALCCGYGPTGLDERGYDCLLVPMASNAQMGMVKANRFCGASKGLATIGSQLGVGTTTVTELDKTVCSKYLPFQIRFVSDSFEFVNEAENAPQGFKLQYRLQDCT